MQALIAGSLKISKSPRRRTDSHSQRHDGYPVNFHGLLVNLKCQETNGAGRKLRLLCKDEKNSREIGYPSDRITKSSARFSEVKPFRQIGDDGDLQPTKYAHSQELSRSIFNSGRLFGCGQRARERPNTANAKNAGCSWLCRFLWSGKNVVQYTRMGDQISLSVKTMVTLHHLTSTATWSSLNLDLPCPDSELSQRSVARRDQMYQLGYPFFWWWYFETLERCFSRAEQGSRWCCQLPN